MSMLQESSAANLVEANFSNELVPNFRGLNLCDMGEPRLVEAFRDEAFIVVNGLMLVKCAGDTVGIPLRPETLPGGQIEPAAWYEIEYGLPPSEDGSEWYKRRVIRNAFIQGETRVNLPGVTKWFKLQDVKVDQVCPGQDLTQKAQAAAASLRQGTPMPEGMSRKDYLNRYLLSPEP